VTPVVYEETMTGSAASEIPAAVTGSSRLADTLAGGRADSAGEVPVPASPSTRKLFSGVPPPSAEDIERDPEERRLSHELDFGKPERYRNYNGTRSRLALLAIVATIIVLCVAAIIFRDNIIALFPGAEGLYAKVGLG
jgi:hypothetical protein